jgi:hypothetical protein
MQVTWKVCRHGRYATSRLGSQNDVSSVMHMQHGIDTGRTTFPREVELRGTDSDSSDVRDDGCKFSGALLVRGVSPVTLSNADTGCNAEDDL